MNKKKEKNKKKKEKEAAGEDEGKEEKVPPMSDHSDTEHKAEPLSADGSLRPERADSESSEWPLPCPTWHMTLVQAAPYIPDF